MKHAHFSEFLRDVRAASVTRDPDAYEKIRAAAPSTAGSEASGGDGGFAVPSEFAAPILELVMERSLAGRCASITTKTNNVTLPVDEVTPWSASGFGWERELAAIGQSKPVFQGRNFRLDKVVGLVPVSDELLEDAPGLDGWMRTVVPSKIAVVMNTAIIRGTGVGMAQGVLNSPALISVSRGVSVTATAAAMFRRLHGDSRSRAVWIVHPDVDVPTTPGLPLVLHGQPVVFCEACPDAGTAGDIIAADLQAYQLVTRGLKIAESMHAFFDAGAHAFRFTLRITGHGLWSEAKAAQAGADSKSPFVTTAA